MKGVRRQEVNKVVKTETISQLDVSDAFTFLVLYLCFSWLFVSLLTILHHTNFKTMAYQDSGECLQCLVFGIFLNLCGMLISSSGLCSHLSCLNATLSLTGWLSGEP